MQETGWWNIPDWLRFPDGDVNSEKFKNAPAKGVGPTPNMSGMRNVGGNKKVTSAKMRARQAKKGKK